MKKQIFSLALSTLFGLGIAMAAPQSQDQSAPPQNNQSTERHRPDPQHQLQTLTKRLNLTADQQKQILPILTDRQQQMESIRSDSSLSQKDRFAKIRSVREDSDSKIKAVLTDDQKQTYDKMQQQMRERAREHREQQNAGPSNQ
jgi:periplasmic protein CpxP/Spy